MSFTNMKIGARMGAGLGLVLVMVQLVAALGLYRKSQIQGHLDQVTGAHMVKIKLVGTMRDTLQTVAISVRNLVLLTDDGAMEAEAKRIQAERTLYAEASRKLAAMVTGEEENRGSPGLWRRVQRPIPCSTRQWGLRLATPLRRPRCWSVRHARHRSNGSRPWKTWPGFRKREVPGPWRTRRRPMPVRACSCFS